jgi:hypothetical protein
LAASAKKGIYMRFIARNDRALVTLLLSTLLCSLPALASSFGSWIIDDTGDEKWRERSVLSFLDSKFEQAEENFEHIRNDGVRVHALRVMFTHVRTIRSESARQNALQYIVTLLDLVRVESLRNQFIEYARGYDYDFLAMRPIVARPPLPEMADTPVPHWRRSQLVRAALVQADVPANEEEGEEQGVAEVQGSARTTVNVDLDVDIARRLPANPRFSLSAFAARSNPSQLRPPGATPPGSVISRIAPRRVGNQFSGN